MQPTKSTSPTAATTASPCSTRTPARSSDRGAAPAISPTAAGAGPYDPNGAPSRQFRDVTCVKIAKDGMVYVCDRMSDRIQVFQKNGKFVKEMVIAKETRGAVTTIGQAPGIVLNSAGSVWDIAFSSDAGQRYLFVADGHNNRIRILRRDTLAEVGHDRRRRTSAGSIPLACGASPSIRTAISTPANCTTRSACRNSRRRQPHHHATGN